MGSYILEGILWLLLLITIGAFILWIFLHIAEQEEFAKGNRSYGWPQILVFSILFFLLISAILINPPETGTTRASVISRSEWYRWEPDSAPLPDFENYYGFEDRENFDMAIRASVVDSKHSNDGHMGDLRYSLYSQNLNITIQNGTLHWSDARVYGGNLISDNWVHGQWTGVNLPDTIQDDIITVKAWLDYGDGHTSAPSIKTITVRNGEVV